MPVLLSRKWVIMGQLNWELRLLFDCCDLYEAVPADRPAHKIACALDHARVRAELAACYSRFDRPSIDSEPIIRKLVIG